MFLVYILWLLPHCAARNMRQIFCLLNFSSLLVVGMERHCQWKIVHSMTRLWVYYQYWCIQCLLVADHSRLLLFDFVYLSCFDIYCCYRWLSLLVSQYVQVQWFEVLFYLCLLYLFLWMLLSNNVCWRTTFPLIPWWRILQQCWLYWSKRCKKLEWWTRGWTK